MGVQRLWCVTHSPACPPMPSPRHPKSRPSGVEGGQGPAGVRGAEPQGQAPCRPLSPLTLLLPPPVPLLWGQGVRLGGGRRLRCLTRAVPLGPMRLPVPWHFLGGHTRGCVCPVSPGAAGQWLGCPVAVGCGTLGCHGSGMLRGPRATSGPSPAPQGCHRATPSPVPAPCSARFPPPLLSPCSGGARRARGVRAHVAVGQGCGWPCNTLHPPRAAVGALAAAGALIHTKPPPRRAVCPVHAGSTAVPAGPLVLPPSAAPHPESVVPVVPAMVIAKTVLPARAPGSCHSPATGSALTPTFAACRWQAWGHAGVSQPQGPWVVEKWPIAHSLLLLSSVSP